MFPLKSPLPPDPPVRPTKRAGGDGVSVRWTGVDGHSTMGLVGAFFGTCRPTKQASAPSDSGPEPVSGMIADNDNNVLTNDKSCGTVEQSMSTTVGVV